MLTFLPLEEIDKMDAWEGSQLNQAKEIVSTLEPKVVIPMHYRSDSFGYPVIGRLEEFTKYYTNIVTYESDTLVLDAETKAQTAVLSL